MPSQSTFNGSSMDTSFLSWELFLRCMSISFSMQREAYVASFMFFSGLKVFTAFISPMVPMEIRSSTLAPGLSNFFAMYTTSRRLWVIRGSLAPGTSFFMSSITFCSCSFVRGGGRVSGPFI